MRPISGGRRRQLEIVLVHSTKDGDAHVARRRTLITIGDKKGRRGDVWIHAWTGNRIRKERCLWRRFKPYLVSARGDADTISRSPHDVSPHGIGLRDCRRPCLGSEVHDNADKRFAIKCYFPRNAMEFFTRTATNQRDRDNQGDRQTYMPYCCHDLIWPLSRMASALSVSRASVSATNCTAPSQKRSMAPPGCAD